MARNLRPKQLLRNRLLAAIPVDRICRGCKQVYIDPKQWQLTVFGDAVCRACRKQDEQKNPDLYADPLLRNELWQRAIEQVRKQRDRLVKGKQLEVGATCACCPRKVDASDTRQQWIWLATFNGGLGVWICRPCWYVRQDIQAGQYREDAKGRVLLVTDKLKAHYPYGTTDIPRGTFLSSYASEYVFNQQREAMYALVVEHMQTIEDLSKNYANRNTHLGIDYSDFYDIALAAAMRSASMYLAKHRWGKDRLIEFGDDAQDVRPYKPYLYRAIDNAVIKDVVRKFRRRLQVEMQTDIKQMLREQPGIEPVLKEIPVSDLLQEETEVSSYLRLCADILGPENWYIFCSWVLLDRTQKEIGEDLGVIQTTISARINVILKKCRAITPPQTQILR